MEWLWISLSIVVALIVLALFVIHFVLVRRYVPVIVRIFEEKPPFILPFGQPTPEAEEVTLTTPDGVTLLGCYLRTTQPRKGVILFGLEFGSNRWACIPYCEFLREAGYDIFTFEMRGQGKSPAQEGYAPLQWVTEFEVTDFRTALAYLKGRPDKDARGVGLFGLSKGGSAGIMAAAQDQFIRCCAVDGIFSTLGTMVPFMRQWIFIYTSAPRLAKILPTAYYRHIAKLAIRRMEQECHCHYPSMERRMPLLAPRPLLMIHGGADNYIKPEMAQALFDLAKGSKELWLVANAKHNQSFTLAGDEYKKRVLAFFDLHLAGAPDPSLNGAVIATPQAANLENT